jgi:hypothetical protein
LYVFPAFSEFDRTPTELMQAHILF